VDETKLAILEKTGSTDVQELVVEMRRYQRDREELGRLRKREAELHYAIHTTANILDKKTADESQAECLMLVMKMRAVWEAAHEVDKVFSRDAPMMLVAPGIVAEQKLEAMRVVLDAPVSSFATQTAG
jgi:hypothetical protein